MIAKQVHMNSVKKSSFAGLVKYLTGTQDKNERVGAVSISNCISDQIEIATLEVLNTQAQNTRATADKTYHLIVSFRAGESPDEATLKAIEERICEGLGFGDHQRVSVAHHDTDNLHIHIAINKIHPTRYTIHEPYNAYHKLGQLCDKLEREYRLEKDNHEPQKAGGENRAADMERHADVESLLGWLKRECKGQIKVAESWEGLHQVMRENGLQIRERANGLVITAENGVSVKASSVSREFAKAKLEQRYGTFQPPPERLAHVKPAKRYEKQPMASRVNTVELHARYKSAQAEATAHRTIEWEKVKARKSRLIEAAKRKGRLKRAAIKLVKAPALGKKLMYSATSKTLKDEIDVINKEYLKARQEIYAKFHRKAWADWLRDQASAGDQEALEALRGREAATGLKGNTVAGMGGPRPPQGRSLRDSITKKGTIIYSVGASAVRDDGDKLKVSRGTDHAGLQAALRLAMERYGSRIKVNGSAAFKEQIAKAAAAANLPVTFDDAALERRRQQLTKPPTTKENKHGYPGRNIRRGPDNRSDGAARQAAASRAAATARARTAGAAKPRSGHAIGNKPNPGRIDAAPPPEARNRVRGLSELSVVHQPDRGQVLLPGHVPDRVEHQGTQPDYGVRRDIHRPGRVSAAPAAAPRGKPDIGRLGKSPPPSSKDRLQRLSQLGSIVIGDRNAAVAPITPPKRESTTKPKVGRVGTAPPPARKDCQQPLSQIGGIVIGERTASAARSRTTSAPGKGTVEVRSDLARWDPGAAAADKYIAEREQKRSILFDIPKHDRYTSTKDRVAVYAGIRQVDGQSLAMLKQGEEIHVLPVDDTTARRLKRIALGTQVGVTSKGAIKTKGRSR
jgi:hypothetical protein